MMGSPACTVLCTLQLLLTWAASLCHISGAPCLTCARAAARLRGPEQLARGEQGAGRPGREQPAPARQVLPESGRKQLRELLKEGLGDHVLYLRLFQARGWRSAPHGPPGARRRLGGGGGSLRLCWRSRRRLRACIAERSARAQPARSVWPLLMGQGCHPPLRMPVWRPCIASVSSGDATLVSSQPKCVMVAPRPGVGAHGLVGGLVPRAGPGPARAALCQGRVAAAGRNRRARRRQPAGRGRARAARRRRARRAAGQAQALRRRSRRAAPPMPGRCRSRDRVCCAQSRRRQGGRGRRPALPGCACAACWLRRGEACSQVRLFRQWAGGRRYGKPHVDRLGMLLFFVKCAQVCVL